MADDDTKMVSDLEDDEDDIEFVLLELSDEEIPETNIPSNDFIKINSSGACDATVSLPPGDVDEQEAVFKHVDDQITVGDLQIPVHQNNIRKEELLNPSENNASIGSTKTQRNRTCGISQESCEITFDSLLDDEEENDTSKSNIVSDAQDTVPSEKAVADSPSLLKPKDSKLNKNISNQSTDLKSNIGNQDTLETEKQVVEKIEENFDVCSQPCSSSSQSNQISPSASESESSFSLDTQTIPESLSSAIPCKDLSTSASQLPDTIVTMVSKLDTSTSNVDQQQCLSPTSPLIEQIQQFSQSVNDSNEAQQTSSKNHNSSSAPDFSGHMIDMKIKQEPIDLDEMQMADNDTVKIKSHKKRKHKNKDRSQEGGSPKSKDGAKKKKRKRSQEESDGEDVRKMKKHKKHKKKSKMADIKLITVKQEVSNMEHNITSDTAVALETLPDLVPANKVLSPVTANCFVRLEPLPDHIITNFNKNYFDWIKPEPECEDQEVSPKSVQKERSKSKSKPLTSPQPLQEPDEIKPHRCNKCGVLFTSRIRLDNHLNFHYGISKRKCDFCLKTFHNQESLNAHYVSHIGKNATLPHCDICFSKFDSADELMEHRKSHGPNPYKCDHCSKSFSCNSSLQQHRQGHGEKLFTCDICQMKFATQSKLDKHGYVHSDIFPFKCSTCPNKYKYKHSLDIHENTHQNNTFVCIVCSKDFNHESSLHQHMCIHLGTTPFQCEVCKHISSSFSDLKKHLRKHTGEKPFQCDVCGSHFSSSSSLYSHVKSHDNQVYSCNQCSKTFSSKYVLNAHLKIHSGETNAYCDVCDKSFSSKRSLECHQRVHKKDETFKCSICDKICGTQSQLTSHFKMHTDKRTHQCTYCQKWFRDARDLTIHTRIHTGEKPFECDVCDKKFTQRAALKKHKMTHDGTKNFTCDVCSKSFVQKVSLQYHYRIHTGEKPFECDVCHKSFQRRYCLNLHIAAAHKKEVKFKCAVCDKPYYTRSNWRAHEKKCLKNAEGMKKEEKMVEEDSEEDSE